MTKSITVTSNDPDNPTTTLRIKAFIEVVFDFEQPSLYLGKVGRDTSTVKSTFLLVKDLEATEVVDIMSSSEFITAKMLDYKDNDGHYDRMKMEVTTLPGLPVGRINETITVKTNLPDKPTADLRITGSVIGDLEVTPEWMTFVVTDSSKSNPMTLTKKIFIINHLESTELKILEVKDTEDRLALDLKPLADGQKYELTATLDPDKIPETGSISGNVLVTTNFPEQKEVAIRYSAVRKSYNQDRSRGKTQYTQRPVVDPLAGEELRDGEVLEPTKAEDGGGIFLPSKDDPFAPGGELMDGSAMDGKAVEKPADTDNNGDSENEEEKKEEKEEATS